MRVQGIEIIQGLFLPTGLHIEKPYVKIRAVDKFGTNSHIEKGFMFTTMKLFSMCEFFLDLCKK
ncbi:hypothetical protein JCM16418A_42500 [Paenibacillus pini]